MPMRLRMNTNSTALHFRCLRRSSPSHRHGSAASMAALLTLSMSAALLSAGCDSLNARDDLIGAELGALPDLRGDSSAMQPASGGAPTVQGLDRRHWPVVVLRNAPGQVEHQPTYFEPVPVASGPARNTSEPPTTATVLQGASDGGSLLAEAGLAPFIFAGELVILPIRAIGDPPWAVHRSPKALTPSDAETAHVDWRWVETPR